MKNVKKIVSAVLAMVIACSAAVCAFGADVIGTDRAKDIALEHAGVSADVVFITAKLDYDDGMKIYEVEFVASGYEYDYDINAYTGKVISFDKERDDDYRKPTAAPSAPTAPATKNYIGADAAKQAALAHAGVDAAVALYVKAEFDYDDGVAKYDVEFYADSYEYDYDINALNGEVIGHSKELEGRKPAAPAASKPQTADNSAASTESKPQTVDNSVASEASKAQYIGVEKAKEIALAAAGLEASQVKFKKARLDYDDGVARYDIEFRSGRTHEYDYEINAITGEITDYDFDIENEFSFLSIFSFLARLFGIR